MARHHLSIPDATMAEVEDLCARFCMTKSKFIARGVQLALDDARKRFGPASNDPVAEPAATLPALADVARPLLAALTPPAYPDAIPLSVEPPSWPATITRGDTVWFELVAVCDELSIAVADLEAEIDVDDDVLLYAGRRWIDHTSMKEAFDLCKSPVPAFRAWYVSKVSPTN